VALRLHVADHQGARPEKRKRRPASAAQTVGRIAVHHQQTGEGGAKKVATFPLRREEAGSIDRARRPSGQIVLLAVTPSARDRRKPTQGRLFEGLP